MFKEEILECNPSETKINVFLCYICNKEYRIHFHLKQNIRKVHNEKKGYNIREEFSNQDDPSVQEKNNEYEEIENHPQPERKGSLKRHIQTVHHHTDGITHTSRSQDQDDNNQNDNNKDDNNQDDSNHTNLTIQSGNISSTIVSNETEIFKCSLCPKEFPLKSNYKRHVLAIHKKINKCRHCKQNFRSRYFLDTHKTDCADQLKWKVKETTKKNPRKFIKRTGESPDSKFKCEFCDRSYTEKHNRERHIHQKHQDDIKINDKIINASVQKKVKCQDICTS